MQDPETRAFVEYWFAAEQRKALTRLGVCLASENGDLGDVLRVCLSRLIVTKERGASLARDVSHSRPHKVRQENDFDVMPEFLRSASVVAKHLAAAPVISRAEVTRCDARRLSHLSDASFEAVITSPPYLNAIDYMRGHKMALVWLGYSVPQLREIRSSSVGSERGAEPRHDSAVIMGEVRGLAWFARLPVRQASLVRRYVADMCELMREIARVVVTNGKAVMVVGNSCLRGVYIENSRILEMAAEAAGLRFINVYVRDLPSSLRYLPTPSGLISDDLGKRMRKECVLTFAKA
ncbi:MAG: hypothetical protein Q7T82_19995 [Armatimonadota bacterium]|nr:hypothetical protein [Armatimonadota bacterium]